MKLTQSKIKNLNEIRKLDLECENYYELGSILSTLDLDENVAPYLNNKLQSGQIKSIDDLSKFFYNMYNDCRKQAHELVNNLT